jgi:hypothetical protein
MPIAALLPVNQESSMLTRVLNRRSPLWLSDKEGMEDEHFGGAIYRVPCTPRPLKNKSSWRGVLVHAFTSSSEHLSHVCDCLCGVNFLHTCSSAGKPGVHFSTFNSRPPNRVAKRHPYRIYLKRHREPNLSIACSIITTEGWRGVCMRVAHFAIPPGPHSAATQRQYEYEALGDHIIA